MEHDKRFLFQSAKVKDLEIFVRLMAWNPDSDEFLCLLSNDTRPSVWLHEDSLERFTL